MELKSSLNPYPPGSEEWHRFNLGIKPGIIGQVEDFEMTDNGILVKGWFWGDVPLSLRDWYIDSDTNEARLLDKEAQSGTASTPRDSPPGAP